ncbi:GH36-type glycosyl hydrolase domain-containing protein [Boseongicola aestuarii]|uniref:N,N'-diacetylchitobiose phosphorylase n=1 Tax=Boseongicola aestuarii TaxID=1470561 RepID=A0A238J7B2_9RHOB|nr:glucoamylase family protein [Boseongicola aestuarii]SMX25764.1 N,N'-diacetylchitobiose phosphorylase [Boseongicola aestuarii]
MKNEERAGERGARGLRLGQSVGQGRPDILPVYAALPKLSAWLKRVRDYCQDPPQDHIRAADWLLDNDYQVARAIRQVQEYLPPDYCRQLPALDAPRGARFPRSYALAQTVYEALSPPLSLDGLVALITEFQTQTALTNAELWAFPSMLRLACLEALVAAFGELNNSLEVSTIAARHADSVPAAETTDRIAQALSNLVALQTIKWEDFVDHVSLAEAALRGDPAGIYGEMTFEARNRYRTVLEHLAARTEASETDIALAAIRLAQDATDDPIASHVGFWLVDNGVGNLEAAIGYRATLKERLRRALGQMLGSLYGAGLIAGVVLALFLPLWYMGRFEPSPWQWLAGLAIALLPATILSVTVVHWAITRVTRPVPLTERDFSDGIPDDLATAVVVPIILREADEVPGILEKIEIRQMANPDPNLRYVILSDLADAATQTAPGDAEIEEALRDGVARLNAHHGQQSDAPFVLLHRRRRFNEAEACWMGWERKRGKLEEFNTLVLTGESEAFAVVAGDAGRLVGTRYAIVLDADTELPPATASRLVGIIAHPLNHPRIDAETGQVTGGYSILQPRVEILPKPGQRTHFSHLYGGDTAIDIYSRAVSDVYQDLFGTGIFVGKGIYDIPTMHKIMADRVPDNSILSHDLFEGVHGRVGLASNVVVYEDLPTTYPAYAMRMHRWIRGDWQLLRWLGNRVPMRDGSRAKTPLDMLDRWKIADNLRRSLLPPAMLAFFVGGWAVLPGSALIWTLLAVAPTGAYLIGEVVNIATGGVRRNLLRRAADRFAMQGGRWFLSITFLVSDTLICIDAISRTLYRLFVSKKHLLEWTSAAHSAAALSGRGVRSTTWQSIWPSSALAIILGADLALYDPAALLPALPILTLWLLAPEIAVWTARRRTFRGEVPTEADRRYLTQIARRTWYFFEAFVGPDDNWLPPDNFQDEAAPLVAHRTSPTNIGLYLVSALSALELGFVSRAELAARANNTLQTLDRMKTHRGHILNWVDTRSLQTLDPEYVSTVDSGNLAMSLIALKQGCLASCNHPPVDARSFDGLMVTVELLTTTVRRLPNCDRAALDAAEQEIRQAVQDLHHDPASIVGAHAELYSALWPRLETIVQAAIEEAREVSHEALQDVSVWVERTNHHLQAMQRDQERLAPWLAHFADVPDPMQSFSEHSLETLLKHPPGYQDDLHEAICEHLSWVDLDAASRDWLTMLDDTVTRGATAQKQLRDALVAVADHADRLAYAMDFGFLYNTRSRLFWIGYNLSSGQMDHNHYDLLATEARLASLFAIAKADAPPEHWFALSRPITQLNGRPSILSWNGSMFEYLMPPLLLPSHRDTLLGESELMAVEFQQSYAAERGVPWGISESAFGATDAEGNYQYRAFGVPGLGIRRGLSEDLVVAPYATALALGARPRAATDNLRELQNRGALTCYGFIEALDFTPSRTSESQPALPIRTFMAHHQGMIMAAISNVLTDDILVDYVGREKPIAAVSLVLQERVPWDAPLESGRADELWEDEPETARLPALSPWVPSQDAAVPQMHFLGNGRMSTRLSSGGSGGLRWRHYALTRWRPDPTHDGFGTWTYVKDAESGRLWSVGRLPAGASCEETKIVFHQHMVEMLQRQEGIAIRTDVMVAPYDDVEIRRMTIINETDRPRTIDLTTYAEVVLAPPQDDETHPAFSKLFVHSEYLPNERALLFQRRPRRPEDTPPLLLHQLVSDDPGIVLAGFDTDRLTFLGRHGSAETPAGLDAELGGRTGWTLDPVMALQARVLLGPMEIKQCAFLTVSGSSREKALGIARRYPFLMVERAFRDSGLEAARVVQAADLEPAHLPELQVLSSFLAQPGHTLRSAADMSGPPWQGQPDLWRFGISGDLPILLLFLDRPEDTGLLDTVVRAQNLWKRGGLDTDIVIIRDVASGYEDPLREHILSILRNTHAEGSLGRKGGVHLLASDQMNGIVRQGLQSAAHVVIHGTHKSLVDVVDGALEDRVLPPRFDPSTPADYQHSPRLPRPENLTFDNGFGGFDEADRAYVVHLGPNQPTPAPWCNVLANDQFGTLVSEAGLGFTWAVNSGEHRLTPWSNDPVRNAPGEVLYLRDEATTEVWTPTPSPRAPGADCQIVHGTGYTTWRQCSHDLEQELTVFVPVDAPVKLVRLRLHNRSDAPRRLTATYYAEWLLGAMLSTSKPHIACSYDPALKAILAQNRWNPEFAERVAFLTASTGPHSVTGDRHAFLGQFSDVSLPDAMCRWDLGGRFTPGGDACAAYQVHLKIAPGATEDVVFVLGEGSDQTEATALVHRWRDAVHVDEAFRHLKHAWDARLGALQIKTPDLAMNLMVNQWLPYQNLSCRIMARAGFYQAGGAYGFRDQLQDMLGVLHFDPDRVRLHILRAAAHQFEEGDVLHWWHPPEGRGVRTGFSDDLLWLPYVTARYVEATGDTSVLSERVAFLSAPELHEDESDRYARFDTGTDGTVLDHCARAIDRSMRTGAHGLPLMGSGDWNDGMDRIAAGGKGESVWLAWFLIATISAFAPLAQAADEAAMTKRWLGHVEKLRAAIAANAWDGAWYIRAFDDDGVPWGSQTNDECRIDLIAQAWSVLCGDEPDERALQALRSACDMLVDPDQRLIRLLTPPFDKTERDPGYIQAYPPGIRENGGQYTHAATWLGVAMAAVKDGDRAWQVFDLINPIRRSDTAATAAHYRREPYVLTGDVSGAGDLTGVGGWSWYTGAAGWAWQLAVHGILGVRIRHGKVTVDPCLPTDWGGADANLNSKAGQMTIQIKDPGRVGCGVASCTVDGKPHTHTDIAFPGEGKMRNVVVVLGS